jgi:hypothetical protein
MKPTRLTRLLNLLRLMRRAARWALLSARQCFATGCRARGLRELRNYRRLRADVNERHTDAVRRLTALTGVTGVTA